MRDPPSPPNFTLKTFLVCGMTGAGKSTFINAATGAQLSVSNKVDSETADVIEEGIPLVKSGDEYIQLVDTPGFGGSGEESETVVLRRITTWLVARHMSNVPVTGVIFLRPMDRVRVERPERSLMLMFKDMLGDDLLDHIFLLGTRWPHSPDEEYEEREHQITSREAMFGSSGHKKVQVLRLNERYSPEDAQGVIKLCAGLSPVTFYIQREVIDEEKTLGQTQAGERIGADFEEKLSGLEAKANKASEYAARAKTKLEEAESAKRELEDKVAQATEEAVRAQECARKAQEEAEAAREQSEKRCAEAEAAKRELAERAARAAEEARHMEERAKKAQREAEAAKEESNKQRAEAEQAKRELEEKAARAAEDARRTEERAKKAEKEAEAAREQSEKRRAEAERKAKQDDEEREASRKAAEEYRQRLEKEKKDAENGLAKLIAAANQAAEREARAQREAEAMQAKIAELSRPVERGVWDHIGNALLLGVTFGQVRLF